MAASNNHDFIHVSFLIDRFYSLYPSAFSLWYSDFSFVQILNRAELLVTVFNIIVGQVQIGFLRHCNAAMAQNPAQCVDVHSR